MFDSKKENSVQSRVRARRVPAPPWLSGLGLLAGGVLAVVIAYLTLTPVPEAAQLEFRGIDKIYHMLAFAGLVFPVIATGPQRWIWMVPLAIAFGGAIELLQPYFNREASLLDFIANGVGVAVGVWSGRAVHSWLETRFARPRR
jgi:VanZ family protein